MTVKCSVCGQSFASKRALAQHVAAKHTANAPARSARRRPRRAPRPGFTPGGRAWLRLAVAPVDFPMFSIAGIPDSYQGRTAVFTLRGAWTHTINGNKRFLVLPHPYSPVIHRNDVDTRSGEWQSETFALASQIFPAGESHLANAFRVIGLAAELKCVGVEDTTSGGLFVARSPVSVSHHAATYTSKGEGSETTTSLTKPSQLVLRGVDAFTLDRVTASTHYFGAVRDGAYSVAYQTQPGWNFTPTIRGMGSVAGEGDDDFRFGKFVGLGDTHTLGFLLNKTRATVVIEVIMIIEVLPEIGTILHQLSTPSAPHDEAALEEFRRSAILMPIAVPAAQNDGWWQRFLRVVRQGAQLAGWIPGAAPYAAAVDMVAAGLQRL